MNASVVETTRALCLLILAVSALVRHGDCKKRHPVKFPDHCQCRYSKLQGSCSKINNPENYPDFDDMRFTGDCLPSIPANKRVCYRTKVRDCESNSGSIFYGCRLFAWSENYKLGNLPVSSDNHSSVYLASLNDTQSRSLCFYNVSVADNSSQNCRGISLQHASDHPESNYVDRLEEGNVNGNSTRRRPCKSYMRLSYTSAGRRQYRELCREELAHLDLSLLDVTSLFIVYWTNDRSTNAGSFKLRAQCLE